MDRNKILEALSTIRDPNTGRDLVNAGMIEDLKIEGNNINFTMALPSLNHPSKSELIFQSQGILQKLFPGVDVNVHVAAKAPTVNSAPDATRSNIKNIIAVASGKGGVGKSTVSVNLALALKKQGFKVGLIDADLYGPSIPTMFGLQGKRPKVQDIDGQPKIVPLEAYGMPLISMGFIVEPEQAVVLRGPRLAGIIKQFFNEVIWPELDYIVVDLPPGTGDIQLTLVQTVPVTGAVIVTTPQEVAVADAIKAVNMFRLPNVDVPILGIVENMSWFTPAELPDNKYYIFGMGGGDHLAQQSESVLLGQVPLVQDIRESGDNGKPVVLDEKNPASKAFEKVAENTIKQVEERNANLEPTRVVQVQG
jgi:ATP-binding protein involved in chromosome partitioning